MLLTRYMARPPADLVRVASVVRRACAAPLGQAVTAQARAQWCSAVLAGAAALGLAGMMLYDWIDERRRKRRRYRVTVPPPR